MDKNLKRLKKEELIELAMFLMASQEVYYQSVREEKIEVYAAFYQLAGYYQNIRKNYNLPPLY